MRPAALSFLLAGLALLAACRPAPTALRAAGQPAEQTLTPGPTPPGRPSADCSSLLLAQHRFSVRAWPRTNFCLHSVPYDEIQSGGVGRDRIPAIDAPLFVSPAEADLWLADVEPVMVLALQGDARAYPLQVLVWHEIVNDLVAGRPVAITYCPLCNAGLAFDRRLDGRTLDFGTTGNLRRADLVMYDRQTESWWQQFTGEAIVGELTGTRLPLLPVSITSYADFKAAYPAGQVLFPDTGYERPYGENPYVNYDSLANPGARWLDAEPDPRLEPKRRVLGLALGDQAIAYPFDLLAAAGALNHELAGRPLVVFWKAGTVSALDNQVIVESKDVGSAAAFSRELDGRTLTFAAEAGRFRDEQTGSVWNIFGHAVAGPLAGRRLEPLPANEFFWFAWAAFRPDTAVYRPAL
ncbi:MAG: DUF3179 domain-containing protein [Candidatus Promineifilaceae bacterium]